MALNIITAKFCSGSNQTWTKEVWQYDYGQVLLIEDVELPEAYEVHFSNMPIKGTAKPQIGNADGVTIPDEYFESGEPIYAWLFLHQGENDGETEKMITIPVKKRSKVVNEQPTPVEQSAITQAIAALNIAVEKSEAAIEHYPQIIDGTWHVWDVTEEEYVDTGVHAQGEQGQPGTDGTDGQDGFSPVITVTDITGGHRVTITDATGTQTFDVMNGQDGQPGTPGTDGTDGYSPTVTVTEITGGHRVTITDAQGAHTFDVMDGQGSSITVDSALSTTSENPVQNKVITEALSEYKADLSELPNVVEASETGFDLDISDPDGNVLAKFYDGDFAVKNFDTKTYADKFAKVAPSSGNSDLDVVDGNGNVLVRFRNGGVKTSDFDSELMKEAVESNTDEIIDIGSWSLGNRLANPIYISRELYNEENPNAQIDATEALVYGHTGTTNAGYRIPTVCVTNDKTILVAGTHMEHELGDYGDFSIDYNRKEYGGSWGTITNLVPFDDTREDYGSVLNNEFLVDRNSGRIYLFYGTEKQAVIWWDVTTEDGDFRYIYSDDDGVNWSSPVSLKSLWDTNTYEYCIPSCTKGITLTNGTLVVPCFCKKSTTASNGISYPLLLIKPYGGDWFFSSVASVDGIDHLDECAVVEGTTENEIWLYCRPNSNYGTGVNRGYNKFVYNISTDTFTHLGCTFDGNRHNCFGIDRITIDGTLIYLMTFTDTHSSVREKITLWASLDGNVWIRVYRIYNPAGNGYSAIDNHDGIIAVAYETVENRNTINVQDISALSDLIYDSATDYIRRNISVQDRMQMLFNALRGID